MASNAQPSVQLSNAIYEVLNQRIESTYRLDCTLSNATNNYELEIYYFTGFHINLSFAENYSEYFSAGVELRPRDMLNVLSNCNDMECTIILTAVDAHTFKDVETLDPIIFSGRVVINNPKDILKQYNIYQLIMDEDDPSAPEYTKAVKLPLDFQIMHQATYDLRRKEVNAMFTNTTMDKVLSYVTDQLGISKASIKTPDNTDKITNLIIPPGKDISSVFHYLQERYGVFGNGINTFISEGKLHIYPGNDHSPSDMSTSIHVIMAPQGSIPGEQGYHTIKDGELYIVSTAGGTIQNNTEAGVEESGNTQVSLQADRIIDFISTMSKTGEVKLNENIQSLSLDTKNQAQTNAINSRYVGETVNSYNQLSNMSKYDSTMANANWVSAQPILIQPGQKVTLHYDDENGVYTTTNGIIEGISYTTSKLDNYIGQPFYIFGSQIVMRLKPEKRSYSSS